MIKLQNQIIEQAKMLATPISFDELEKNGIIEKKGAWFVVINWKALPKYASVQIRAIKQGVDGKIYAQFPKNWKRAQQSYKRMTGKEFNE